MSVGDSGLGIRQRGESFDFRRPIWTLSQYDEIRVVPGSADSTEAATSRLAKLAASIFERSAKRFATCLMSHHLSVSRASSR
jgi:hypothetical protein